MQPAGVPKAGGASAGCGLQVPLLCKILRSLLVNTYSEHTHEHDVGGVTDPFLQVKVRWPSLCGSWPGSLMTCWLGPPVQCRLPDCCVC